MEMTTYLEIKDLPIDAQQSVYLKIVDAYYRHQENLMGAVEALDDLYNSQDNVFALLRKLDYEDDFYASMNVNLPFDVKVRLNQIIQDFRLVAVALCNSDISIGKPQTETGETK
jgi:hypothetical protein